MWSKAREYSVMCKVSFSFMILDPNLSYTSKVLSHEIDSMKPAEIKIIDFGSACREDRTVYSYIQVSISHFCDL